MTRDDLRPHDHSSTGNGGDKLTPERVDAEEQVTAPGPNSPIQLSDSVRVETGRIGESINASGTTDFDVGSTKEGIVVTFDQPFQQPPQVIIYPVTDNLLSITEVFGIQVVVNQDTIGTDQFAYALINYSDKDRSPELRYVAIGQ